MRSRYDHGRAGLRYEVPLMLRPSRPWLRPMPRMFEASPARHGPACCPGHLFQHLPRRVARTSRTMTERGRGIAADLPIVGRRLTSERFPAGVRSLGISLSMYGLCGEPVHRCLALHQPWLRGGVSVRS
jgi:hypothetical protein